MDELEAMNKPMSLHEACTKGEIDVVAEILSPEGKPELVNYVDEAGSPPLVLPLARRIQTPAGSRVTPPFTRPVWWATRKL